MHNKSTMSQSGEHPKKLLKTLRKLEEGGEVPVMVVPAIPGSYRDEKSMALARIGRADEEDTSSWLVLTEKSLVFVKAGLLRNRVQSIPLENISGVEYVDEFHTNTLKVRIGEKAENVVFYDERQGVEFYKYIRNNFLKDEAASGGPLSPQPGDEAEGSGDN